MNLPPEIQQVVDKWLQPPYDEATRKEIQALIDQGEEKELYDRFYTELEFGTGGLRGLMGAGQNRMNRYTVGRATQGLANYINRVKAGQDNSVAIAYDSRLQSDQFSRDAACVLAANGIKVYLFDALRPTPELSFAVRELGATSGIVITASHNPKAYNGYKVYWEDGAQIISPHDKAIISEVQAISDVDAVQTMDYDQALSEKKIEIIGEAIDEKYLQAILALSVQPDLCHQVGGDIPIVFTPLHGTGITLVPKALERWGFTKVTLCKEQSTPDGHFPNAPSPNPEEPEALALAVKAAKEAGAELVLATDPDADRVGIAIRRGDDYPLVTGNQIAAMLVEYVLVARAKTNTMPADPRVVTTIVTTELISRISEHYEVPVEITLTGFKWIGGRIREYEEKGEGTYLVGGEESYGYLVGTHARDKDAVVSSCFIAEMLADSRSRGETLLDRLDRLFMEYGIFEDSQISMKYAGAEGKEKIAKIMTGLRENPPEKVAGKSVVEITDVQEDSIRDPRTGGDKGKTGLPKSNVLVFRLDDGSRVMARPSGTEPKVKFYFSVCDLADLPIADKATLEKRQEALSVYHEAARKEWREVVDAIAGA